MPVGTIYPSDKLKESLWKGPPWTGALECITEEG